MALGTPRHPTSALDARKLSPALRERLERDLRIAARALQICEPYRRLYAHVRRKCPGIDVTSELRLVHAGEECAHPYLRMAWRWMYMIHPLAYVGPLEPEARDELDLNSVVYAPEHIRDFLKVLGMDAGDLRELTPDDAQDIGNGEWISLDPRDALRVPVVIDLGAPNTDLAHCIEVLRQVLGAKERPARPAAERTWNEDEGWRAAFDLIDLKERNPKLTLAKLAHRQWPYRDETPSDAEQAGRLMRRARKQVREAGERVCRMLDLRRRAADARRSAATPPATP